jgi:thymidylate kinase
MPVIAFEGLDGVGKTTAAAAVAESCDGILATHPKYLTPQWSAEKRAVNEGTDADARFYYFLQLNALQLAIALRAERHGFVATLDSSVYRTVATHRVLGSVAAREYGIQPELVPRHAYYLDLGEQERRQRLLNRDGSVTNSSHWDELLDLRQDYLREEFASFGLPAIDANLDTPALVSLVRSNVAL